MVLDGSALAATLFGEPEADDFVRRIDAAPPCLVSAATLQTDAVLAA